MSAEQQPQRPWRSVASGRVEDLESLSEATLELAAEPAGCAGPFAQRDEIAQDMREAQLAFGSVDIQVDGVAVRHDHPAWFVAQQRAGRVAISTRGDLNQRGDNGRRDRQPPRIAGLAPRRFIRATHGRVVEMRQDRT